MTSVSFRAYQDFVSNPQVWLFTGILYRPHMISKIVVLALAVATPRLG
jgi:hypothetical protein